MRRLITPGAKRATNRLIPYAVIPLAAILATLPLALNGPSCGHDLTFHLVNWIDAAHQWHLGTLRPWWCFPAAWNTGEPRYVFYPPVSWVLGALLTLLVGIAHAPLAYTFVALTTCGFTMRRFLTSYVTPPLALLGACLYLAHPYLLFTATERTAYAELLAAAWLPWLLQEALRTGQADPSTEMAEAPVNEIPAPVETLAASVPHVLLPGHGRIQHYGVRSAKLAIPVALLWLTNTPSAVLATYTLATVLAVRTVLALRKHQPILKPVLIPATLGYLWGLALSSLYLLPAFVQHSAVEVDQAFSAGMRPEDGTLFTHTGELLHDQVVHQASILAAILLGTAVAAAVALAVERRRPHRLRNMRALTLQHTRNAPHTTLTTTLLTLTALTTFLLTPASLFFWHHLPELHFLQFPWRTLMLQGVVTVTLLVLAVRRNVRQRWVVPIALALVTTFGFAAHHSYAQFCDDEDAPSSVLAQYDRGDGFDPYDEYTPRDADNDLLHQGEPAAWTGPDATSLPPKTSAGNVHLLTGEQNGSAVQQASSSPLRQNGAPTTAAAMPSNPGAARDTLTVQVRPSPTDRFVIVRQRSFRNWQIILDGTPVPRSEDRDDDLLALPLPNTNPHTLTLHYRWSADQYAGSLLSTIAVLALPLGLRRKDTTRV